MRKYIALFAALTLFLTLTGCSSGDNTTNASTTASTQAATSEASAASTEADTTESTPTTTVKTFSGKAIDLVDALQKVSQSSDYPHAFDGIQIDMKDATDNLPKTQTFTFAPCAGVSLVFYSEYPSGELYQIFYYIDKSKISQKDLNGVAGYLMGLLENAMEPDADMLTQIDKQLGMDNITSPITTFATGTVAEWNYIVTDTEVMLNITAK